MNTSFLILYTVIQVLLLCALGLPVLYILVFSFAGIFYRQAVNPAPEGFRKIAVLIPGYREDNVIVEVARDALLQDYPAASFDVVIIADSFQQSTLESLAALPVKVIVVSFEKSTKSKALNKAMEQLAGDYDIAVILDADNLMEHDFLSRINASFDSGFIAVQGHRTAKNTGTSLAMLDAASEEINNHIFRKGHRVLGLSSAIIGSGMAFQYSYFKKMMLNVTAIGGFDKEIELMLLKDRITIEYLDDAYVYDEKVQKAEVFSNQRRRWLSAQLIYFRRSFFSSLQELILHGNVDYFDKAIQFIQPPRVLLLGMVFILGIPFFILNRMTGDLLACNYAWTGIILGCIMAFLFSVPLRMYNLKTLKALLSLPKGMLLMLGSLLKIRGANKQFIHTEHSVKTTLNSKE
jgi:cellulose synthase/poly-beta-1,6-N-acetylglucosamine synthase-like glycosyltransferase